MFMKDNPMLDFDEQGSEAIKEKTSGEFAEEISLMDA